MLNGAFGRFEWRNVGEGVMESRVILYNGGGGVDLEPLSLPPTTPHPNPLKLEILNTVLYSGNYTVSIPQGLYYLLSGTIIRLSSNFSKLFLQILYS